MMNGIVAYALSLFFLTQYILGGFYEQLLFVCRTWFWFAFVRLMLFQWQGGSGGGGSAMIFRGFLWLFLSNVS